MTPSIAVESCSYLISAHLSSDFEQTRAKPDLWGRLVESMVGAHLCNQVIGTQIQVYYWREGNKEVDYVLVNDKEVVALAEEEIPSPLAGEGGPKGRKRGI